MKKGLLIVMLANVVNLVVGLVSNFILPKFLSIESYSIVKTYGLYMTYSSFFSLGYVDGMYLEYGGKDYKTINKGKVWGEFLTFTFLECIFMLLIIVFSMFSQDYVIGFFGVGMLSTALVGFFRSIFQATGEFKTYARSMNIEKILLLCLYVIAILLLHINNAYVIIILQVLIPFIIVVYFVVMFLNGYDGPRLIPSNIQVMKKYIITGFILMISNFSLGLLTGVDRFVIKFGMTNIDFAHYSFAVSTESVLGVFLTPITVTMYNYFCQKKSKEEIIKVKNMTVLWAFLVIAAVFPCQWILTYYLPEYYEASNVIFILFSSQVFSLLIRAIYVNVYKVEKKQNKYLKQVILFLMLAVILDVFCAWVFKTKESIAFATLIVNILWLVCCEIEYKQYRFEYKNIIAVIALTVFFLGMSFFDNPIIGSILYIVFYLVVGHVLMKNEFKIMVEFLWSAMKNRLLRK